MLTKGGSTKIVNLMNPGAGVLMLGRGHTSHYIVKMYYIYITLFAFVLRDYDAAFQYHHLCYDGVVNIQIWAPLTRSQCKVPGRWPLRPVGLLFIKSILYILDEYSRKRGLKLYSSILNMIKTCNWNIYIILYKKKLIFLI